MQFLTVDDIDMRDKRILIREDFNVPVEKGVVTSNMRIKAALPGIKRLLEFGAQIGIISHLGRPDGVDPRCSLEPVAKELQKLLGEEVFFSKELAPSNAQVVMYENIRFYTGETNNDPELAAKLASLGDVFVMDAFGSAHRAHASTVGVCEKAKQAVAGDLLVKEINALDKVISDPSKPVVAVIGGSKISSKIDVMRSLLKKVDYVLVGGGMANTLIAAKGVDVKDSLYEPSMLDTAKEIIADAGGKLVLPTDYVWNNNQIMDIGFSSVDLYSGYIKDAATVIWNGPMGVFEQDEFANGTRGLAVAITECKGYTLAGGGETLAAIDKWQLQDGLSYISTGGGAFLEYVEGKILPSLHALEERYKNGITTH